MKEQFAKSKYVDDIIGVLHGLQSLYNEKSTDPHRTVRNIVISIFGTDWQDADTFLRNWDGEDETKIRRRLERLVSLQ